MAAGEDFDDAHRPSAFGACLARVPLVGIEAPLLTGRLIRESETEVVVETDPLSRTEQVVAKDDVDLIKPSTVSPSSSGPRRNIRASGQPSSTATTPTSTA